MPRECSWCRVGIPATFRSDAKFCSQRCRQASHRFGVGAVARARAERPLRLAYADPPYPGKSGYYRDHKDFAGEVDHEALLSRLAEYDGWALSTSAVALADILRLAVAVCPGSTVRVAAWVRGGRHTSSRWPLSSWEAVVFAGGRRLVSKDQPADSLIHVARPRTTDPARVIGAKPAVFCYWLFRLLGALPGDSLDDLFPGSGGVSRAWALYSSCLDPGHGKRLLELEATENVAGALL